MTVFADRELEERGDRTPPRAMARLQVAVPFLDLVALAAAVSLAAVGREALPFFATESAVVATVGWVAPLLAASWVAALWYLGGYRPRIFGAGIDEFGIVLRASLLTAGAFGIACYLAKYDLSRGFFVLAFLIGPSALLLVRYGVRHGVQAARRRGHFVQRALIAGDPDHVDELHAVLTRESWLGYRPIGALTPSGDAHPNTPSGTTVVGSVENAAWAAEQHDADVIFFAGGSFTSSREMRRTTWQLESYDVQVIVTPSVTDVSRERVHMRPVGGLPMIHVEGPRAALASRWAKRTFDVVLATVLIALLSPVLTFAALRIKVHDGGPVLFRQTRVGQGGDIFGCFKFRTMVINAEEQIARMQAEQGVTALLFKDKNDPRVTRPGRWLRRFSLDELPQLFNVVTGDMSLIGPRPQVPREVAEYDEIVRRRLRVRPGMTGLWQVSGRNDLSIGDAVRLDLYYVDNWSMLQDLAILFRTIGAVLSARGAY